jgi:hypothetical protein
LASSEFDLLFVFSALMQSWLPTAQADLIVTDWTGFTSNSATGMMNGIAVNGSIIAGPGFNGIYAGEFSGPGWLAGEPLPSSAEGIGGEGANGANQFFTSAAPLSHLRFYVDNFDSGALEYYGGTFGSFVGYTFATNAVPESDFLSGLGTALALGGVICRHRRGRQES